MIPKAVEEFWEEFYARCEVRRGSWEMRSCIGSAGSYTETLLTHPDSPVKRYIDAGEKAIRCTEADSNYEAFVEMVQELKQALAALKEGG